MKFQSFLPTQHSVLGSKVLMVDSIYLSIVNPFAEQLLFHIDFGWSHRVCTLLPTQVWLAQQQLSLRMPPSREASAILGVNKLPWMKFILLPATVNKVLSEQSLIDLFTYCLWLLLCCSGIVQQLQQRQYSPQSIKYLPPGPLQNKFADLCVTPLPRQHPLRPCPVLTKGLQSFFWGGGASHRIYLDFSGSVSHPPMGHLHQHFKANSGQ